MQKSLRFANIFWMIVIMSAAIHCFMLCVVFLVESNVSLSDLFQHLYFCGFLTIIACMVCFGRAFQLFLELSHTESEFEISHRWKRESEETYNKILKGHI